MCLYPTGHWEEIDVLRDNIFNSVPFPWAGPLALITIITTLVLFMMESDNKGKHFFTREMMSDLCILEERAPVQPVIASVLSKL